MNQKPKRALACMTVATLTLAGCGSPNEPATPPPAPVMSSTAPAAPTQPHWPTREPGADLPDAASSNVDVTDPEQVALETVRIIHTRDTTLEQRSGD